MCHSKKHYPHRRIILCQRQKGKKNRQGGALHQPPCDLKTEDEFPFVKVSPTFPYQNLITADMAPRKSLHKQKLTSHLFSRCLPSQFVTPESLGPFPFIWSLVCKFLVLGWDAIQAQGLPTLKFLLWVFPCISKMRMLITFHLFFSLAYLPFVVYLAGPPCNGLKIGQGKRLFSLSYMTHTISWRPWRKKSPSLGENFASRWPLVSTCSIKPFWGLQPALRIPDSPAPSHVSLFLKTNISDRHPIGLFF